MSAPTPFERVDIAGFKPGSEILVPVPVTTIARPKQLAMWNYRLRRWQRGNI